MASEGSAPSGEAAATSAEMFTAVSASRMSRLIVDQVKLLIRQGRLVAGDRLPSERELCERFGVSRVTVREALRMLEATGLVRIRVGAKGGAFVTSPSSTRIGEGLADLLNLSPMTAGEVTEARQVFELGIVPMVVQRATARDIAELRAMLEEHQDAVRRDEYKMSLSVDFHARVAACTHNRAIEMLVRSFHGPLLMSLLEADSLASPKGPRGVQEHREFVDAVANGDAGTAAEIMRTHLRRTADRVGARRVEAH